MSRRCIGVAVLLLHTVTQLQAVLVVTSPADSGPGSLRDQVTLSVPGDTIQFAVPFPSTIFLNSGIVINHTLWIQGPGASKLTVSGNFNDRVFITSGSPVVLSGMTIRDGLVVGLPGTDGAPGQNGTAGGSAAGGGVANSVNSSDTLIVSNCWFVGNVVRGGPGGRGGDNPVGAVFTPGKGGLGGTALGGGLYSLGHVSVVNCTFSDNQVVGGPGGGGGNNNNSAVGVAGGAGGGGGDGKGSGADVSSAAGVPSFTNCTFSANSAEGGNGGSGGTNAAPFLGGNGGNSGSGECGAVSVSIGFTFLSCTVVSNDAIGGLGGAGGSGLPPGSNGASGVGDTGGICGYAMLGCVGPMGNTVVADNFASTVHSNVYLNVVDLGFNYIGDDDYFNTCEPLISTRVGTVAVPLHAVVGPLAQNGSGLPTHAPLSGSPLVDWGNALGTTTDERRAPRPYGSPLITGGDGSDIGAFEFGSTPLGMSMGGGTNGTGGAVVITWPAWYGDFLLQSTPSLLAPDGWSSVTDEPVVINDSFVVTNAPVGDNMFYRLIRR